MDQRWPGRAWLACSVIQSRAHFTVSGRDAAALTHQDRELHAGRRNFETGLSAAPGQSVGAERGSCLEGLIEVLQLCKGERVFGPQTHAWMAVTAAYVSAGHQTQALISIWCPKFRAAGSREWTRFGAVGARTPCHCASGRLVENIENPMGLSRGTFHSVPRAFTSLHFHSKFHFSFGVITINGRAA